MTTQTEALKSAIEFAEYCLEELDLSHMASNQAKRLVQKSKEALSSPNGEAQPEQEKERCVGCEACIDTACGRDECPKGWPKAAQPEHEPSYWLGYGLQAHTEKPFEGATPVYTTPPQRKEPEQTNTRPYYTIDELNAWADEKEKQAWRNAAIRVGEELSSVGPDGYYDMNAWQWLDWAMENVKKSQPEQEPFCYVNVNAQGDVTRTVKRKDAWCRTPLYTTPPQRTWVGLTPQERDEINEQVYGAVPHHVAFHYAIEAKLKEKNT